MTAAFDETLPLAEVVALHRLEVPLQPLGLETTDEWQDATAQQWVRLGAEPVARRRHEGVIEFNGHSKYVRVTDPEHYSSRIESDPPDADLATLFHLLGFTEMVDAGTAAELHDQLALANPGTRIVSIATDGIGKHCPPQRLRDALLETFNDVALNTGEFIRLLCDDSEVELLATSMNNHVTYRMARNSLNGTGPELNIQRIAFNEPALVPRERVIQDVVFRFLCLHIGTDVLKEAAQHPVRSARYAARIALSLRPRQLPSFVGNVGNILKGMRWEDVERVVDAYDTVLIAGGKDPLHQQAEWRALGRGALAEHSAFVDPNKGHGAVLNSSVEVARRLAEPRQPQARVLSIVANT